MEEIFPKQPFIERLEFLGSLEQGDKVADGLHVVLEYPLTKVGEIKGSILGTTNTFKELSKVYDLTGQTLRMHSTKTDERNKRIWSENVIRGNLTNKPYFGSEMSYKVADLKFHDLTIEETLSPHDFKERHLSFLLSGPSTLWMVHEYGDVSFTGEENVNVKNSVIELNENLPFVVEIRSWYFYDKSTPPESFQLKTKVLVLDFKTILTEDELSNEEFKKSASAVAEDLILLVSFLSRRWITWYSYNFNSNELRQKHIRSTRKCSTKEIDYDNAVVPFHHAREFLKIALTNFRKLKDSKIDLYMPLVYYISGAEATYIEERFSIFFLSLERIKDLFAIENNLQTTLSRNEFNRLRSILSDIIQKTIESPVVENVLCKLPELNRPSLRTVLDAAFTKYNVIWKDLYPVGTNFTLIKTRDNLFHSSSEINIDQLFKELHRLQALVERLLLSMLGWKDFRNAPPEHEKQWLSAPTW